MDKTSDSEALKEHKKKWDALAVENDRYYVRSVDHEQSDQEYEESGRKNVREFIEGDPLIHAHVGAFSSGVILEIGCGSGRITKTLSRLFKHVVAIDIAPTMLEKAQAFVGADNVTFVESNGANVPVMPESVDIAFSYIVYQHFPSAEAVEESVPQVSGVRYAQGASSRSRYVARNIRTHGTGRGGRTTTTRRPRNARRMRQGSEFAGTRSCWLSLEKVSCRS